MNDSHTAEILQNYEKKIFDLKQLLEISKSLNSTLDIHILINSIMYTCMGQLKILKVGIYIQNELGLNNFKLHRNYMGFDIDHSVDYIVPYDHDLIKLFSADATCFTVEDILSKVKMDKYLKAIKALNPSLIIPLKAKSDICGILILGERISGETFSDTEKGYVLNIALLAAIAIHNSIIYEVATTDMMTKLKMRHFFMSVLAECQKNALIGVRDLSLIMLDIDHFKKCNDTYGHTCGDDVLKKVANIIKSYVRSIDIAARYGGEEFVILLPEADMGIARGVAERIRKAVEQTKIESENQTISVTISLGIAQFDPKRDTSTRALIKRADEALYLSKQNGRNRTSTAE